MAWLLKAAWLAALASRAVTAALAAVSGPEGSPEEEDEEEPPTSLVQMGLGCCNGLQRDDEYYNEAGLTLEECVARCVKDQPLCKALEHNPWALGTCHLFQAMPTGLSCPLTDKVCWSLPPEMGGPSPVQLHSQAREMAETWHAQEFWDALNCFGKGDFDSIRHFGVEATRLGGVDHVGFWKLAVKGGFVGDTPIGDTEAFFNSEKNAQFLGRILANAGKFQNLLRGDTEFTEVRRGALAESEPCTHGVLFMLWLCLKRFRETGDEEEAKNVAWALRVLHWTLFGGPESSLDLMQSTSWPTSSWDLVVATLDADGWQPESTYEEYLLKHSAPQPFLPGPLADLPAGHWRQPRAAMAAWPWPCGASQTARVALLGNQRQMQMHQLSALQAAWGAVCGADLGAPTMEVLYVYTHAGPMAEYDYGSMKARKTDWEAEMQQWQGMRIRFTAKGMRQVCSLDSLDAAQADFKAKLHGEPGVRDAHLFVCGEPVYVCTAASRALEEAKDTRPLLAHLGMALLHQPQLSTKVLNSREKVARFLGHFLAMLARPTVFASAANRITIEQVYWQVGVRLPLAHFAGVHLQPRADREEEPKALLFRSKFPLLTHVWTKALKLFARRERSKVELVDMNYYASLSWAEIAFFRAVVLLPHNVHLVRTADLYALETMLFVPSAPFIFQFIFPGSNLYGGHGAPPIIRLGIDRRSQRKLHRAMKLQEAGYTLGEAPTAPEPGETLPRKAHLHCPYRFPGLSTCNKYRSEGVLLVEACPWGSYDLEREMQTPLSCEDVVEADPPLRPIASFLCADNGPEPLEPTGADPEGRRAEEAVLERGKVGLEVDPFDHLYGDFNPWCNLESYRYWYAHTEYFLLKGLQKFGSTAELLLGLAAVLVGPEAPERRRAVLEEMRAHHRIRVQETVQWWAQALLVTGRASASAAARAQR